MFYQIRFAASRMRVRERYPRRIQCAAQSLRER